MKLTAIIRKSLIIKVLFSISYERIWIMVAPKN